MNRLKGIPYGISDFNRLRNDNFYFVDKTIYLPLIERMPSYLYPSPSLWKKPVPEHDAYLL